MQLVTRAVDHVLVTQPLPLPGLMLLALSNHEVSYHCRRQVAIGMLAKSIMLHPAFKLQDFTEEHIRIVKDSLDKLRALPGQKMLVLKTATEAFYRETGIDIFKQTCAAKIHSEKVCHRRSALAILAYAWYLRQSFSLHSSS